MEFDYGRLKGRMVEKGYTQQGLAKAINLSPSTLNLKLNNKSGWTQNEILCIKDVLDLKTVDPYFFTVKIRKTEVESE